MSGHPFAYPIIHPTGAERIIIIMENKKEFTETRVARCSDGIIRFKSMSVLTERKLSQQAPINPPIAIKRRFPVNVMANEKITPVLQIRTMNR